MIVVLVCLIHLFLLPVIQSQIQHPQQYLNVKFQSTKQITNQTLKQQGKVMTLQSLLKLLQFNPDTLLSLKNVYIPKPNNQLIFNSSESIKNSSQQNNSKSSNTNQTPSVLINNSKSTFTKSQLIKKQFTDNSLLIHNKLQLNNQSSLFNSIKNLSVSNLTSIKNIAISNTVLAHNDYIFNQSSQPSSNSSIQTLRQYMNFLTNNLRQKNKVQKVKLSAFLNKIAQSHSQDMIKRQFFAHQNPDGQKVGDRAVRNGYNCIIGENLAQSFTLRQAQKGFQNSLTHFQNSINKNWRETGVGVAYNGQMYLITVLFTPRNIIDNQLTKTQLQQYKLQLSKAISEQNPNLKVLDLELSTYIDEWLMSNRATNLMSYVVSKGKYRTPMTAATYTVTYSQDFVERVKTNGYFNNNNKIFSKFGIGIKQKDCSLQIYVIYI